MKYLLRSDIFKSNLRKVLSITLAWFIISNFTIFYDYFLIRYYNFNPPGYDLWLFLGANFIMTIIGGLLIGTLLVVIVNKWLRSLPYGVALLYLFGAYILLSTIVITITAAFINSLRMDLPFYHSDVRHDL